MSKQDIAFTKICEAMHLASEIRRSIISKDTKTLENELNVIKLIGARLSEFQANWTDSKINDSIDLDVFSRKKIDFQKMESLMTRIKKGNEAIKLIDCVNISVKEFELYCEEVEYATGIKKSNILLRQVNFEIWIVENEIKELKTQIDIVNIYHQNFMISKATRIANIALGISSLAFLLTILQITLQVFHII